MIAPDVILLNDPTRGIDIGTKQEIYLMMRALADQGKAILFYSSDNAELIGCSDRVMVLYEGRIVRILAGNRFIFNCTWTSISELKHFCRKNSPLLVFSVK